MAISGNQPHQGLEDSDSESGSLSPTVSAGLNLGSPEEMASSGNQPNEGLEDSDSDSGLLTPTVSAGLDPGGNSGNVNASAGSSFLPVALASGPNAGQESSSSSDSDNVNASAGSSFLPVALASGPNAGQESSSSSDSDNAAPLSSRHSRKESFSLVRAVAHAIADLGMANTQKLVDDANRKIERLVPKLLTKPEILVRTKEQVEAIINKLVKEHNWRGVVVVAKKIGRIACRDSIKLLRREKMAFSCER
ncbi:hypothetical protein ACH5RR_025334 [Cinchona calisaya]|uniref:Uncharacterized protein n=1 Tax=Cinchona calisaya TaxID=153742 RepID=A0ABD2Z2I6_9GENT